MILSKAVIFQLIFLVLLWHNVESSKILVVYPFPARSHFTLGVTIAEALADNGHEVTMINPYPDKTSSKIRDISTENIIAFIEEGRGQLLGMDKQNVLTSLKIIMSVGVAVSRKMFENPDVQKLMNSNEHFDAIIIENFMNDAMIGLGYHFKAPVILVAPTDIGTSGYLFANPSPSSYAPNKFGEFTRHMNFWQRFVNLFSNVVYDVINKSFMTPLQTQLFEEFITKDVPYESVIYNISLMLTNSHPSVTNANPLQPNIIEIGGYHVKAPKKLPDDLQRFMDNAKEGVILFSMGSNLKSADLSLETRDALLKAFSKIKQKVLWKFETDLENLPKNVKIMKWLPQNDILAHPNIRAFISHGGLLSTIETIYHGVPLIGIPIFGDQKCNIASAVANGFALSVPLSELNEEKLSKALDEILNNPKYRENARRRSKLMHDRPMKPIDTAIYWIEYVIRNQGAPELRSAALDLKWYQLYMIDIVVFIIVIIVIILVFSYVVIRKLLRFCVIKKQKTGHTFISRKNKEE